MERRIFDNMEVYGNDSVIGLSGETSFTSLDKAIDFFMIQSEKLNDVYYTVYLTLKQNCTIFEEVYYSILFVREYNKIIKYILKR